MPVRNPAMNGDSKLNSEECIPCAGGSPISPNTAHEAAQWLTLMMSGTASEQDHADLQCWRKAHADNERAWHHIETVCAQFQNFNATALYKSLSTLKSPSRRRVIKALLWLCVAGGTGLLTTRSQVWRENVADYRSAVGEQRHVTLEDGTRVLLNTNTSINVGFNPTRRIVSLVAGEIMVTTAHEDSAAHHRPFIVETTEGTAIALGTRFTVRQENGYSKIVVFEGAVELHLAMAQGDTAVVHAGQAANFTQQTVLELQAVSEQDEAWTKGYLLADNLRLADFISELARYRTGYLGYDTDVGELRLSGVFPLTDTDNILDALPNSLPVEICYRTRYWAKVEAKTTS